MLPTLSDTILKFHQQLRRLKDELQVHRINFSFSLSFSFFSSVYFSFFISFFLSSLVFPFFSTRLNSTQLVYSGRNITDQFKKLPTKEEDVEYYEIVSKPISFLMIRVIQLSLSLFRQHVCPGLTLFFPLFLLLLLESHRQTKIRVPRSMGP